MKYEKKNSWEEVITQTDLTLNSRREWQTIRKLSNDPTTPNPSCQVNANQVAHQLLINSQGTMSPKRPIPPIQEGTPTMVHPFSKEEYRKGIAALNNNNAARKDDVLVDKLKHLGPKANKWLHTMLNVCFTGNKIPKIWRQSKSIVILKPGKDSVIPKNYRPISLLCHTYNLYEQMGSKDLGLLSQRFYLTRISSQRLKRGPSRPQSRYEDDRTRPYREQSNYLKWNLVLIVQAASRQVQPTTLQSSQTHFFKRNPISNEGDQEETNGDGRHSPRT